jgi:hypothetical protein
MDKLALFLYVGIRKTRYGYPRSVTEFYGGIVFFPLYQARKYVLTSWYCNSEILSHGVLFLLVSSAIDVATAVGWCPIECPYVQWLQQMGCVETLYVRWLQQMEHTHRGCVETCMLGVRTCNGYSRWVASRCCMCDGYSRARPEFAVYSAFKSFLLLYT